MYDFLRLNKLRGFTPRQQRLLELEAVYLGTQYAGLPAWEVEYGERTDPSTGLSVIRPLCGYEREPTIKAGVVEEKVGKLVALLVGEGRFPQIEVEPEGLVEEIGTERLQKASRNALRDLIVKGSGCLALTLYGKRVEFLHLRPEWCEPVFVSKAGRPRAEALAAELQGFGVALPAPRPGSSDHLWTPDDAEAHDLCWLRWEYVYHEEAAVQDGSSAADVMWRRRVDYTPTMIVEYEDVLVYSDTERAVEWKPERVTKHAWGVVPVVWVRSLDAEDGEPEGPSLISESFRSLSEAADRALTRKDQSAAVVANPKAYTIDLEDLVGLALAERGASPAWLASSSEVLHFKTRSGASTQGRIGLLEPTGKGPELAKAHLDDLMSHAARVSGVLAHDPQTAANVQSGVAYERMMRPTADKVGDLRTPASELISGAVALAALMLGKGRVEPQIQWGPVFAQTAADLQATAQALTLATGGAAVLSQESGAKLFAVAAEIEDPEAEAARVTADADEAMQQARDALAAAPVPAADEDVSGEQPPEGA